MRTEWAVLADAARARIFARAGGASWQDLHSLSRSVNRDKNGREVRLPAAMQKLNDSLTAPRNDDDFIERLAHELRVARKRGDYEALVLVAPQDVIDAITNALDSATRRAVAATLAENLVGLPVRDARRELRRRFQDVLRG